MIPLFRRNILVDIPTPCRYSTIEYPPIKCEQNSPKFGIIVIDDQESQTEDADTKIQEDNNGFSDDRTKVQRIQPGDTSQCEFIKDGSQCPNRAVGISNIVNFVNPKNPRQMISERRWDGPPFCPMHLVGSGTNGDGIRYHKNQEFRTYLLNKWQDRVDRQANNPKIKSLREDIGILRMTLENKMNRMEDDADLDMRSGQLTELVSQIERTILTAHKIEKESGLVLDKTQAMVWIQMILEAVSRAGIPAPALQSLTNDLIEITGNMFPDL